ncbi:hypothetical protein P0Y35_03540 [Kiritimatiellaeota bacterium B1221]|nr:hypothetical protein [Kiritimatiellaeota bacterium B1221]
MTSHPWQELAVAVSCENAPGLEILRKRGTDVIIARAASGPGETAIVKCWNRRGLRGFFRRFTRSNIGWREYTALRRLHQAGIPCPEPYAYLRLPSSARHTEVLISEDLGICEDATEHYKTLRLHSPEAVEIFEQQLIDATLTMVHQGLLDPDHRLPNFVIPPNLIPVRIDFELCIPVRKVSAHPRLLGLMIGTFLGSIVFALQPDTEAATRFTKKLFMQLPLPDASRAVAAHTVQQMLHRQKQESGIDTSFTLPENPL